MAPLLDVILAHVPPPQVSLQEPFAMCVAMIERDPFVGRVATGGCRAQAYSFIVEVKCRLVVCCCCWLLLSCIALQAAAV